MVKSPVNLDTLVDLLVWRGQSQPHERLYTFLLDGEADEQHLTYQQLEGRAQAIAAALQAATPPGTRALLLYPPGLDYICAFFGCLYAGVIAVPVYPPDPARLDRTLPRLQAIAQDAQASLALTTTPILTMADFLLAQAPDFPHLEWLATDAIESAVAGWQPPPIDGDTVAFLQYTSGSTAAPKGVMLTHANLLHNSALIHQCFGHSPHSQGVIWLPPYHDMGLIGGIIQPLYGGFLVTLLSPLDFLKRPLRWLQAISRYGATTSGGPNFAYDLCVRKVGPQERATLDLSSWDLAFNGAEPVRAETMARFAEAFAGCGFRREAFYPCYGLAEGTLIASGGHKAALPVVECVDGLALGEHRIVSVAADCADAQTLVGCGHSLEGQQIVIADPETSRRCPPDRIGEVWVGGPSVAGGYWGQPEETEETFQAHLADGEGPFLRTGDLGFLRAGELFITGRIKDLIIIRGRNHYPQDIEQTVEASHPALRPGCGAAFSVEVEGEERLVVAQEVRRESADLDTEEIVQAIRQAVAERHELQVHSVVLLRPRCIPKTSSGKIQRHACRAGFEAGTLEVVTASVLEAAAPGAASGQPEESFIRKALAAVDDAAARQALLTLHLQEQIGRVLRLSPSQVDAQQAISTLGVDSLQVIELQHSLETSLGVTLPMEDFIQGASLAQLVPQILSGLESPAAPAARLVPAQEPATEHPLSRGQRAMWFLHRLAPGSAAYNITSAVRIVGELDVPALRRAFQSLVDRHPSLRTTFPAPRGEPVQHIHAQAEVHFDVEDAATWDQAMLNERLAQEAQRPFDLERGPLLRVHLFKRSAQAHVLLLVVHHIVADFWSLAVLVRELGTLYPAEQAASPASLPPLSLQYTDYARWQAQVLAGSEGERLWAYWKEQLGDLPALDLPTDRPRPAVQTYHGASQALRLDAELTRGLKALGQAHEATLYMTLLAAFQVLLHRYSGQDDVLVGSPTAGRGRADLAGLVGYLVNPVVLRADLSGDPSFVTFLERVRETALAALAHQDFAFDLLVERLQPQRDLSRSPIFQVWFTLQKAPLLDKSDLSSFALSEAGAQMELGGLSLQSMALTQRVAQFDLALAVAETAGGLVFSLQYNSDLFEADTIGRMLGHLRTLLQGIVAQPKQPLSALPLLSAAEQEQLLYGWNETRVAYDREACLHQVFEAQVARTPEATAVIFPSTGFAQHPEHSERAKHGSPDRKLTFRELDRQANQLAHYLRAIGVGPDVPVGVCMERSPEMVVGLLGILKAGGAYVPLDPTYPAERLAYVLDDVQAVALLTQEHLVASLSFASLPSKVICLDQDWDAIARESDAAPPSCCTADNLAYVIYTSGSTGRPKGVQIPHDAVINFLDAMRREPGLTVQDVLLSVTTLSFDIAGLELFLPLTTGATLVLASHEVVADGNKLAAQLAASGATVMQATPSTWRLLLESGWQGDPELCVLCGGEAFPRDLANQLVEKVAQVWNMYGPTETTIWSAIYPVETGDNPVSIGRPIANTQLYLLDQRFQPVPIGVPGELFIAGDGLARGYFERPGLTAEKFVPDLFGPEAGARMYRTGDLARYRADGNVEFLGRMDHQVKIRGFRIEIGEIETVLGQHENVQETVVVAREDGPGGPSSGLRPGKRLVAYVVPEETPAPTVSELRRFLREKLPDYMVPSAFMTLEALPLTPNGKVNRRALPAVQGLRPELDAAFVMPRTALERQIAEVWQEVLQVEKVGAQDNFFELGGHSLLMARIQSRLEEQILERELSIVELFQYPTVHSLAEYLSQSEQSVSVSSQERVEVRSSRQSLMRQQRERRRASRLTND